MTNKKTIEGFSKLSKTGKIKWIAENFFKDPEKVIKELADYWHKNADQQKIIDGFSENTISNFYLPYGIAPNFMIDGKPYAVPMVIEESSVVAAASAAAKFWLDRGGFKTKIINTEKVGHISFKWQGTFEQLNTYRSELEKLLRVRARTITENMEKRGGGISNIEFINLQHVMPNLYQVRLYFQTCDSMGANFINSVLETFALTLEEYFISKEDIEDQLKDIEIIMSILSNYTPKCLVKAWVECPISELGNFADGSNAEKFAAKFYTAVRIAQEDVFRATTHNKGIFNGIDAVVIATGNDFRAIEAAGHAFAARSGQYRSLSNCSIEGDIFKFELEVPLALGTIGGLTSLHPIAKTSLELLGNPGAEQLMSIVAATGLAQNFAAVRSLVTTGIQKGHMKMHLQNILNQLQASKSEEEKTKIHFEDRVITYNEVRQYLEQLRK